VIGLDTVFALDVGTRNVVGILTKMSGDKIEISHMEIMEHETRAMEDGQIHDIGKVANVSERIKKKIEEKSGEKIDKVAVAVAGRTLVSQNGIAQKELNIKEEVTEEDVLAIELQAIQNSMLQLDEKFHKEFHCVGYTVCGYKLDGDSIKNPVMQKGSSLEVEILATFLPKIVVDSMFTMVKRVGLEIINLTLEPIAAISVVIPEDMRKLNLALVDIGAGTSDIAITDNGQITGYEMVPMAGDELTEKVASEYLLEFSEAEKVKRELLKTGETVTFTDVLGLEYEIKKSKVVESLESTIELLAEKIVMKIAEINSKPTQAVILIGGGSLVPLLKEKIAEKMGIIPARVAVRGTEVIKNLDDKTGLLKTAEFVTVVGIANMAFKGRDFKIVSVTVEGITNRILSFKNKITVMDALLSSGVDMKSIYSRNGNPLTIKINGKLEIVKGEMGKLAVIKVNGEPKKLEDEIDDESEIVIQRQRDGRDAICKIEDITRRYRYIKVEVDGKIEELKPRYTVNGKFEKWGYIIKDRDEIIITEKFYLKDILRGKGELERKISFKINGNPFDITVPLADVRRNGENIGLEDELFYKDKITFNKAEGSEPKIKDVAELGSYSDFAEEIKVIVNDKEVNFGIIKTKILKNGKESIENEKIQNGDNIEIKSSEEQMPIVSDIFRFYRAEELLEKKGGMLRIEVNGRAAEFTTKLKNRDRVNLYY
jgi:cell division protein FtsA